MKPFISIVALLICLAAGSTFPGRTDPSAPPALPIFGTSLLEKVPDTALVAVQVRDLARRWSEIRENTAISQLQDAILCGLGIAPEDVPGLVADQAVFALAPSGSSPSLVPFVLLRPDDRLRALEVLAGLDQVALRESRDALWVAFAPVDEKDPHQHAIHSEWCQLTPEAADTINQARRAGGRIIAVGTTSVRVLESAARETLPGQVVRHFEGQTNLFILPGHVFREVDALITDFHLPKATLIMLVSSFAGKGLLMKAYHEAIVRKYRFYSYGDAMLIL